MLYQQNYPPQQQKQINLVPNNQHFYKSVLYKKFPVIYLKETSHHNLLNTQAIINIITNIYYLNHNTTHSDNYIAALL